MSGITANAESNVYLHPLYHRMPILHNWSGEGLLRIRNLHLLESAFGEAIARQVVSETLQRVQQSLGASGVASPDGHGKIGLLAWDSVSAGHGHASPQPKDWLVAMARELTLVPIRTLAGSVHADVAVSSPKGPGAGDVSNSAARSHVSSGAAAQGDAALARVYRADMAVASPLLAALAGSAGTASEESDAQAPVLWRPIVATSDNSVAIYEASLGLLDRSGQYLAIDTAIEAAERLNLVHHVDRHVLACVLRELSAAQSGPALAVSLSAVTLRPHRYWQAIFEMLENRPNIAARLIIQLRDRAGLADWAEANEVLSRLRAAGCRIAIENFGLGNSSFRHLFTLRPEFVTVDRYFLTPMGRGCTDVPALLHLVGIARAVGADAVIDGVDSEGAAATAKAAQVAFHKGGLIGPPRFCRPWANGCSH